jgi:hypothetical protein
LLETTESFFLIASLQKTSTPIGAASISAGFLPLAR